MNGLSSPAKKRPELGAADLEMWRRLVEERCGVSFTVSRAHHLARGLWERMKVRGTRTYLDYYHFLKYHAGGDGEWSELVPSILNAETGFFRHQPSFKAMTSVLLPSRLQERPSRLRLWSAGCSIGMEAYSMAIVTSEFLAGHPNVSLEVLASDLNAQSLERVRQGRYRKRHVTALDTSVVGQFFLAEGGGEWYGVRPELKALVTTRRINLVVEDGEWERDVDVIFCQNVFIYFRQDVRMEVCARLARCLVPGGFLVLAPGELVGVQPEGLRAERVEECLVYRRSSS